MTWPQACYFIKSESLKKYITVFQAETIALINASKYLLNENTKAENIHFYIYSQALILALEKRKIDKLLIAECQLALNELTNNNLVTIN